MSKWNKSRTMEKIVGKLFLESFSERQSLYHNPDKKWSPSLMLEQHGDKLRWHIGHSLSKRQKEVMRFCLDGKTEREIGGILGISQQVVHIYKRRALKKLQKVMAS